MVVIRDHDEARCLRRTSSHDVHGDDAMLNAAADRASCLANSVA